MLFASAEEALLRENASGDDDLQHHTPEKGRELRRSSDGMSLAADHDGTMAHDEEALVPPAYVLHPLSRISCCEHSDVTLGGLLPFTFQTLCCLQYCRPQQINDEELPDLPGPRETAEGAIDVNEQLPPQPPPPPAEEEQELDEQQHYPQINDSPEVRVDRLSDEQLPPPPLAEDEENIARKDNRLGQQESRTAAENAADGEAGPMTAFGIASEGKQGKKRKRRKARNSSPLVKEKKLQLSNEEMKANIQSADDILVNRHATPTALANERHRDAAEDTDVEQLFYGVMIDKHLCPELVQLIRGAILDGGKDYGPEKLRRQSRRSSGDDWQHLQQSEHESVEQQQQHPSLEAARRSSLDMLHGPPMVEEQDELPPPVHSTAEGEEGEPLGGVPPPLPAMEEQDETHAQRRSGRLSMALQEQHDSPATAADEAVQQSERTVSVARYLEKELLEKEVVELNSVLAGRSRMEASRMFFEVMLLGSHGSFDIEQDQPYSDIYISKAAQCSQDAPT